MAEKSRKILKTFFESGDTPTSNEFQDLIDSILTNEDDGLHTGPNQSIGIGQSNPLNKLDLAGNMVIGANFAGMVKAPEDGLAVQGDLSVGTADSKEKLTVDGAISLREYQGSPSTDPGYGKLFTRVDAHYHLKFDGETNYIDLTPRIDNFKSLNNGTISLWYKPLDSQPKKQGLLYIGENTRGMQLIIGPSADAHDDESLLFYIFGSGQPGGGFLMFHVRLGESYFTEIRWYHILITVGDDFHHAYIDGMEQQFTYKNDANLSGHFMDHLQTSSDSRFYIGRLPGTSPSFTTGYLDELAIFNRAVTGKEVTQLFEGGRKQNLKLSYGDALAAYWRMGDNHQLPEISDLSGNDNHGILKGTKDDQTLVRTDV